MDAKPLTMGKLDSLWAVAERATPGDRRFCQVRDHCGEYNAFLMPLNLHIPDSISEGDCEFLKQIDPDIILRLIAAARASIPRPIAEAPRDGTRFDLFVPDLSWRIPNCSYDTDGSLRDGYGDLVALEHRAELIKKSTWLPIPKGGVS